MAEGLIRQHRNTFEGGLDTDTVEAFLKPNTYRDAQNVSIVTNNKFFSLTNIQGTTNVGTLPGTDSTCNIIGVFRTQFLFQSSSVTAAGMLIFGFDNSHFKIWAAIPNPGDIEVFFYYELYQEAVGQMATTQFVNGDLLIDAVAFNEYGYDNVYFTDNYHELRKIRCIIPTVYTPNFLTETEIGLLQRKAIGQVTGLPAANGTLLTGTYQLAYQLYHPDKNKYTRFSLLSNPVHIYTSDTPTKAGIGLPSSSKITSTIVMTHDEAINYTHFRIALVKNIFAEGTDATILNTVGITKTELISTYTTGTTSDFTTVTYDIKSDAQYDATTIDEIVTDLIDMDHAKTLTIKRNRLLVGNIVLKDLSYNNGNPAIGGGSVLKAVDANVLNKDTFSNSVMSSTKAGYFRDEVYRFAISYFDKYGNFSTPKTLDLSTVTDNRITVPIKDMKFPNRNGYNGSAYNILNSNDQCVSLGLRLTNITNHPKWAVGFVILRAKRKKRIQFQTPIFPVAHIYLPGAIGDYPTVTMENTGAKTYSNATPSGPLITGIMYNMFHGAFADTTDLPYEIDTGGILAGETRSLRYRQNLGSHIFIYPDSSIYTKSQYIFQGNEQFETVDAILPKFVLTTFLDYPTAGANPLGEGSLTSVCSSFFAINGVSQYYSSTYNNATPLRFSNINLGTAKFVENLSSGISINGFSLVDPSKFITPNVPQVGFPFTNQRSVIVELKNNPLVLDSPYSSLRFYTGPVLYSTSSYEAYDANKNLNDDFFRVAAGFVAGSTVPGNIGISSGFLNVIELGNVVVPQNDNRYGGTDDYNEFILTGTQVNFTIAEQATISAGGSVLKTVDVWGGDCFVSYHTFKLSDTVADIMNNVKTELNTGADYGYPKLLDEWGRFWTGGTVSSVGLHYPAFFKNASQYITVALESEFIGSVRDSDTCDVVNTVNGIPIWGASQSYKSRTPMTYSYNINLKKQNDQKIFVAVDSSIPIQLKYKARAYYSDQKIYNTLINGFDVIRTGNYYDYEERYGRLVKLAQAGDNLYGIQDKAIFYIPLNERVLEVTDASQLAVRTGDFLGLQLYLTNTKGSQAIQSIVEQGQFVYGADLINKQVFKIEGQQLTFISDKGMISKWQENLTPLSVEHQHRSFYDYLKDEYWLWKTDGTYCYLWNEDYNIWVSNQQFPAGGYTPPGEPHIGPYGLIGGTSIEGNVYLVSSGAGSLNSPTVNIMYHGEYSKFFDTYVTPSVKFIVNPELEHAKTFDNMLINSTDRLKTLDMSVTREATDGNQSMNSVNLTNQFGGEPFYRGGEGGYMLKTLRDSGDNSRLRGLYSDVTLSWNTNTLNPNLGSGPAIQVGLTSVITNARLSAKTF